MSMSNSSDPIISPWETPWVTRYQLYCELISAPTLQSICLEETSSGCLFRCYQRMWQKILLKSKPMTSTALPLSPSNFITEDTHDNQAWLVAHKSIMAIHSPFLGLHALGNGFQVNFLCKLSQELTWGQMSCSCPVDGASLVHFCLSLGNSPTHHYLSKLMQHSQPVPSACSLHLWVSLHPKCLSRP